MRRSWSIRSRAVRATVAVSAAGALLLLAAPSQAATSPAGTSPAATSPASGAATPPPETAGSGVFRPWAVQSETFGANRAPVGRQQAIADARNNDLITAHPIAYRDSVSAMRAANPRLRLYVYLNAMYAQRTQPDQSPRGADGSTDGRPPCVTAAGTAGSTVDCSWPDAWYLHDASGAYVRAQASGNYLMNPRVQGWRDSRVQSCRDKLADSGYDGCYLDMLGPASVSPSYVSAPPVDPQTGTTWDLADYVASTTSVGGYVTDTMGPVPVFANGLSDGTKYFAASSPTRSLLAQVDGGVAEGWLRKGIRPVDSYPTEQAWRQSVDMLVDAERAVPASGGAGKPVLVVYKVWVPATQAQKDAHRRFAMASFLLGAGGRSMFFYSDDPHVSRTASYPGYRFDIGTPTGAYTAGAGVYRRAFTRGVVLVNPTTRAVTVDLGASYTSISGAQRRYVTLAPDTGDILRR